jgi:hypothetical protein
MATHGNQLVCNCPDTPEEATLQATGATAGLPGRGALKHARNAVAAARGVDPGDPADHHRAAAEAHEPSATAMLHTRTPAMSVEELRRVVEANRSKARQELHRV